MISGSNEHESVENLTWLVGMIYWYAWKLYDADNVLLNYALAVNSLRNSLVSGSVLLVCVEALLMIITAETLSESKIAFVSKRA